MALWLSMKRFFAQWLTSLTTREPTESPMRVYTVESRHMEASDSTCRFGATTLHEAHHLGARIPQVSHQVTVA